MAPAHTLADTAFVLQVKPESGHPQQEGEGSSEISRCLGSPTPSQHPRMAAQHQEPGCLLAPSLPAAHGLTPQPATQIQHPAPESRIPHPASQIQHPTPSILGQSQNPAATHTPAPGSGLWRGAASCGVAELTLKGWISMAETHAFYPPPFLCISSVHSPMPQIGETEGREPQPLAGQ